MGVGSNVNLGSYLQTPFRVTLYSFVWTEERKIKGHIKISWSPKGNIALQCGRAWRSMRTGFRRQSKKRRHKPSTQVEKCAVIDDKSGIKVQGTHFWILRPDEVTFLRSSLRVP